MTDPMIPGDIVTDEMIERLHEERGALLIAIADQRARAEAAEKRLAAIADLAANRSANGRINTARMRKIEALARGKKGETP